MADFLSDDESSGNGKLLLAALGLGALAMYLGDPRSGRRRRARLTNQYRRTARLVQKGAEIVRRDATQRASGTISSVRGWIDERGEDLDDAVLQERVRAALGRATPHRRAIQVQVAGNQVTLHGDALAHEADRIIACARRVRGVRGVQSMLRLHDSSENFPTLQRGGPHASFEAPQDNWSPAWRSLAGAIGAGLTLAGWIRGGAHGIAMGTAGAGMFARAIANRDLKTLVGVGDANRGVVVRKAIHIDAPVSEVYRNWTIENFPLWMSHVREVRPLGGNRHHWVVEGPARMPIEWDSEITSAVGDREMEWRALPGSTVDNAGRVRFVPEGDGTQVEVTLCYMPPGGVVGHAVAKALGGDPRSRMDDDLMRFKSLIETGRPPHDAGARKGTSRMWPFSAVRH